MKKLSLLLFMISTIIVIKAQTTFTKVFSGYVNDYEINNIIQTYDNNYVICTANLLIKIDNYGIELWRDSVPNYPFTVSETSDHGFILSGYKLTKLDAAHNLQWESPLGTIKDVKQTSDGGYICITDGTTFKKTNSSGTTEWTSISFATPGIETHENSVIEVPGHGYVMCGEKFTATMDNQYYIVMVNQTGTKIWDKLIGSSTYSDFAKEVKLTSDSCLIVVGTRALGGSSGYSIYLMKIQLDGTTVWSKDFEYGELTEGLSVSQTQDGGYIVLGQTSDYFSTTYDIDLLKTDGSGNQVWHKTFGVGNVSMARSLKATNDGGFIFVGTANDNLSSGLANIYVVKTNQNGITSISKTESNLSSLNIYPNPAKENICISLDFDQPYDDWRISITDNTGRKVFETEYKKRDNGNQIFVNNLISGIYMITLINHTTGYSVSEKVIVE